MYKVSVIIPVYNVEDYLSMCIESVLKQTYKNIEVILINDGSTDSSGKICDKYSQSYDFIRTIHKKNEGLGMARNTGIDAAQGDYITFIDSDDVIEKNMIKKLMIPIIEKKVDTVIGGFKRIDKNDYILYKENYNNELVKNSDIYNKVFIKMLGSSPKGHDSLKMSVWNVMYSMKIIADNRLKFISERKIISEDIVWNYNYLKLSENLAIIDSDEYKYRITPESLTQKYKEDKFKKICELYNYLYEKVSTNSNSTIGVVRLQRQFLVNVLSSIENELMNVEKVGYKKTIANISDITSNDLVRNVVSEYPIHKLSIKPLVFMLLVKFRCNKTIYLALKVRSK